MSSSTSRTRIAVAPKSQPWHDRMVTAVQRGGGSIAEIADADALIWLGSDTDDLRGILHPGIQWIQLRSAGVEKWIEKGEIDDCRLFTSTRGVYSQTVAEHVVALIFAAARGLHVCARANAWNTKAGEGRLLRGSTVGIIGAGGIGEEVIRYLAPFGVRILAVTRSGREVPGATVSLSAKAVNEIWPQLDYLVLSAPATPETTAIVGRRELAAMPDHAWIVNVARGSLIDTDALVDALASGSIGGAALDVTEPEPLPSDHPLWKLPNVLITPHVANPSALQIVRLEEHVETNVARFVRGEEPMGAIDLAAGY